MQFREIKICELDDFVHSKLYQNSSNIPITKQRAISQKQNPRANNDDIALIVAIDKNNQIVGFIGSLPDKFAQDFKEKVYWNSCWWIDQNKGKQAAIPLLLKFIKCNNNNVMFRDMTDKTREIIARLNKFEAIKNLTGFRYFIKLNGAEVLTNRVKSLTMVKPILSWMDGLVNFGLTQKNKAFTKNTLKVEYIKNVDDETEKFIQQYNDKELFKRGKEELNWILNFPWVMEGERETTSFYYFSDTSKQFKNYLVKIYSETSELIGVLFLNNHNGLVKIPYVYFAPKNAHFIVQFIYQFLEEQQAISFLTFNKYINESIHKKRNPFWKIQKHNKEFVVPKTMVSHLDWNFDFQDGEGDYVFT